MSCAWGAFTTSSGTGSLPDDAPTAATRQWHLSAILFRSSSRFQCTLARFVRISAIASLLLLPIFLYFELSGALDGELSQFQQLNF